MDSQEEGPRPRRWGFPLVLAWIGGVVILSVLDVWLLGRRPPWQGPPYPLHTLVFVAVFFNFPLYGAGWGSLVLIAYIWLTRLSTLAKVCCTLIVLAIAVVVVTCLFWWWALGHMAP